MSLAIGRKELGEAGKDIEEIFEKISGSAGGPLKMIYGLPAIFKLAGMLPVRLKTKGKCQQIIQQTPVSWNVSCP